MKQVGFLILLGLSMLLFLTLECKAEEVNSMRLSSPAFEHNGYLPAKFTCQGQGVNPELEIESIPEGAKSLALIMDDPDAPSGDFVHWVLYNIPVTSRIEENSIPGEEGITSTGRPGYVSPCPPTGTHHYFFKVYALDKTLDLGARSRKADLLKAMSGHILGKAELISLYQKK